MNFKSSKFLIYFLILVLFTNCQKKEQAEQIKIAGIYPLTGRAATFGIWTKNGVELAIDEINAEGGINGVKLEHIIEDTQTDQKLAVTAFEKVISLYKVNAGIGFVSSGEAMACAPIAERKQTVMITPVAGTEKLKTAGDYVFRTRESGLLQADAVAKYAVNKLKIKKASILFENAANALTYKDAFKKYFTKLGGEILDEVSYDGGITNFRSHISKLKSKDQPAVYAPGISTVIGHILKQSNEMGFTTQWLSSAGIEDPQLFEIAGDAANGVLFAASSFSLNSNDEKTRHFVESYKKKYNEDPSVYAANAYDAVFILVKCFRKQALKGKKLVDSLYQIKNFPGASGNITFDEFGEVFKPTVIKIIKDNEFLTIEN